MKQQGRRSSLMLAYSFLLGAGFVATSPWWLARMVSTRRYREGLLERLGRVPARLRQTTKGKRIVWLHAVSVGEILAASGLITELERAFNAAQADRCWLVVISTTTRTGQLLARERFGADRVFWFPLDFAWAVRAWLRALGPQLVVLVESELWPRLLSECTRQGIPVAVVNARMSDRSFRRAKRVGKLWARVFGRVSGFLVQSEETARRLHALGVPTEKVTLTGNLKYDIVPRQSEMIDALRAAVGRYSLVVGGSLLAPEEQILLEQWPTIHRAAPGSVLLLAPRHPERFDEVLAKISEHFPVLHASSILRAYQNQKPIGRLQPFSVVLLDTVGDLASVYGLADVAFVGGSLVQKGGHNPLEPARWGVPVLIGPSYENFREVVNTMLAVDGLRVVQDGAELARVLSALLKDRVASDALGQRGRQIFESNRGATRRTVHKLQTLVASTAKRSVVSP